MDKDFKEPERVTDLGLLIPAIAISSSKLTSVINFETASYIAAAAIRPVPFVLAWALLR